MRNLIYQAEVNTRQVAHRYRGTPLEQHPELPAGIFVEKTYLRTPASSSVQVQPQERQDLEARLPKIFFVPELNKWCLAFDGIECKSLEPTTFYYYADTSDLLVSLLIVQPRLKKEK